MSVLADPSLRTRIVVGEGVIDELGARTAELPGERVLLVTDAGLVAAGHVDRAEASLRAAGLVVERFADVHENPTDRDVDACLAAARAFRPDILLGLGGGSSVDVAKGTNFVLAGGGRIQDYWGVGKGRGTFLPLVAVPTTAGTGTEVQSFALVADAETHQKMACGDPQALPRLAVLDPELTLSMPRMVTACTGLDAIGHAVETAVTKKRSVMSDRCAREAFRLAARNFPRVLSEPDDLVARGGMIRASACAGLAIEHSMLGAAHAMANPLTARFGVPHGQAVAMCLPLVVRFNAADEDTAARYATLAREAELCGADCSAAEAVAVLASTLSAFVRQAELPTSIAACGIGAGDVPALAEEAARQWTAGFNPRAVGEPDLAGLYQESLQATG